VRRQVREAIEDVRNPGLLVRVAAAGENGAERQVVPRSHQLDHEPLRLSREQAAADAVPYRPCPRIGIRADRDAIQPGAERAGPAKQQAGIDRRLHGTECAHKVIAGLALESAQVLFRDQVRATLQEQGVFFRNVLPQQARLVQVSRVQPGVLIVGIAAARETDKAVVIIGADR